eukprot:CAMPEP_0197689860 /NCGR_PEP_ID=MMETSP1338-20131121/107490_1 /TAXON_ID=43686 ORGANISM="Pelagodinium beii, Strain RCC1491" /NCGR_SAMPLE_ID=MMETSP1338 /ASSEMBLY_ACC=CAM_ASM_000754 /LENGTH=46 /DNA_ID= /DNA_START= /DNA_END= /DNA_ORIENTATION=
MAEANVTERLCALIKRYPGDAEIHLAATTALTYLCSNVQQKLSMSG